MINEIKKCSKCNLCKNQKPLLDKRTNCDVMWIGLSAKKVNDFDNSVPLDNNTNSGKIIEQIESKLPHSCFYKTNLVKCLPLNENNKLRYPTKEEMNFCIDNLLLEIKELNPKVIFVLGRRTFDFICKYFDSNGLDKQKLIYIEHPSYIYVYKRKYIDDYIDKVVNICNNEL